MYREDRIRTCDPLVPNQVLYQAELLPDEWLFQKQNLTKQSWQLQDVLTVFAVFYSDICVSPRPRYARLSLRLVSPIIIFHAFNMPIGWRKL